MSGKIAGGEWPVFGWVDDIRGDLAAAMEAGRPAALATLYRVEGSAPRGPGAQMLFVAGASGNVEASGYFSGDCIEGDVAGHAAQVLADGEPRRLHYGMGSPWIDIRLRCGGALSSWWSASCPMTPAQSRCFVMRASVAPACGVPTDRTAASAATANRRCWHILMFQFLMERRYDPPRRLIVSGGDPGALAAAHLGALARFETILVQPKGPAAPPPFPLARYMRDEPAAALEQLGVDRWTAYLGATHEDHHDLGGCLSALRAGAGYVAMIGAKSRADGRRSALAAQGATDEELARLRLSPGVAGLGKSPWEVATGIIAEIMQALNPAAERA